MKPIYWKISTFASLGASAFFAVHSPFGGAPAHDVRAAEQSHSSAPAGRSPASWLGGLLASSASLAPALPKDSPLAKLESAKTVRAQCEAVSALAEDADDEAAQAIIDLAGKPGRAKAC